MSPPIVNDMNRMSMDSAPIERKLSNCNAITNE